MFVTTYQNDYMPPYPRPLGYVHPTITNPGCKTIILPPPPKPRPPIDHTAEWTDIAPMGRLMKPRLLPLSLKPEQIDEFIDEDKPVESTPVEVKPNEFLTVLKRGYPSLYDRLKLMPFSPSNRRPVIPVNDTIYQSAYNVKIDVPGSGALLPLVRKREVVVRPEPCDEYRMNILNDLREGLVDIHLCDRQSPSEDKFRNQGKYLAAFTASAWPARTFSKTPDYTEYMDTINKVGCVIMRNQLHDHSLCENGRYCKHQILHTCRYLK